MLPGGAGFLVGPRDLPALIDVCRMGGVGARVERSDGSVVGPHVAVNPAARAVIVSRDLSARIDARSSSAVGAGARSVESGDRAMGSTHVGVNRVAHRVVQVNREFSDLS